MSVYLFLKRYIFLIVLILIFLPLFFYRLDYNTLSSWDEGWYGSIARNIIKTGDIFRLSWNEKPYFDHPPMGFWLMALSYKLFGINEFSTRLPSAFLGLLTIILIYKTAIEFFGKRIIGFVAAFILGTSVWYLIRVRSGNLESILVFFYILTVYLSIKSSKNFFWFPLTMIAFGGLVLSKTLVGVSAVLLIGFLNFHQFFKKKNLLLFFLGVILFIGVVFPWYKINMEAYPDFVQHHFFNIGMRDKTFSSYFNILPEKPLFYLHMGIRKWYYLWLVAVFYLIFSLKFLKKKFFFFLFWNFIVLYPFLTSEKTELWHLIPVYLPISFIIAVGFYEGINNLFKLCDYLYFVKKRFNCLFQIICHKKEIKIVSLYLLFFLLIAGIQIKTFLPEVFPQSKYIPDDVDIAKRAGKYTGRIFLDDDFLPLAIFYSGKNLIQLSYYPSDRNTLVELFKSDEKDFIVITRYWAVDNLKKENIPYKLLEKNNSFSIISRP